MRTADKIAEILHEKGVRHVFGIIGAGNVCLFDAIANQGKIEIIPMHHEQAATMAATYYFRTSGRIAPIMVTTGAGSSNCITGVLAAYMDSIPLLIISGNEPSHFFRSSSSRVIGVQGYRSAELVQGIAKYAKQVVNAQDAIMSIQLGFDKSLRPRQGPVWIDVPQDIQRSEK